MSAPHPDASPVRATGSGRSAAFRWALTAGFAAFLLHSVVFDGLTREMAHFNVDIARDFGRTLDFVEGRGLSPIGPVAGGSGFDLGPLVYVLLAPAVAIDADPDFLHSVFVGASALALLVFALALSRVLSPATLGLMLVWLVGSGLWAASQWRPWHSSLLPLVVAVAMLACERLLRETHRGWVLVAAASAALAVQLHATMATLVVMVIVAALARWRWLGWRWLLAGAGTGLAAGALMLRNLLRTGTGGEVPPAPVDSSYFDALGLALAPGWGVPFPSDGLLILGWLLPVLALGSWWGLRRARRFEFGHLMWVALVLGLGFSAWAVRFEAAMRYFHCVLYPLLVLAGLGLDALPGPRVMRVALPVVAALGIAAIGLTTTQAPPLCSLQHQRAVAWEAAALGLDADTTATQLHGDLCRGPNTGWEYLARVAPPSGTLSERHFAVQRRPEGGQQVVELSSVVNFDRTRITTGVEHRQGEALASEITASLRRLAPVRLQFAVERGVDCPIVGTLQDGGRIEQVERIRLQGGPVDVVRYRLAPSATELSLHIGPCPRLSHVDLY